MRNLKIASRVDLFGAQVKNARWELNVTQKEFAAAVGVTQVTISRIENGWAYRQSTKRKIMAALDTQKN